MRNRPDFVTSCTSLLLLATALAACFLVVVFSWPRPREHERAVHARFDRCCEVVVGGPVIDGADDVVATEAQTASISASR